jgi:hypothetical protein
MIKSNNPFPGQRCLILAVRSLQVGLDGFVDVQRLFRAKNSILPESPSSVPFIVSRKAHPEMTK